LFPVFFGSQISSLTIRGTITSGKPYFLYFLLFALAESHAHGVFKSKSFPAPRGHSLTATQ
jgi:hypothetical protein